MGQKACRHQNLAAADRDHRVNGLGGAIWALRLDLALVDLLNSC